MKKELIALINQKMEYIKNDRISDYKAHFEFTLKEILEILGVL